VCAHQGLLRSKVAADTHLLLTGHVFGDVTQDLVFAEIYWLLLHALKIKKKILFLLCSIESFHISHAK
jgi:hypothetical protein